MSDGWSKEQRFEELYRSTYPDIVAYCRRRLNPDLVDDVVAATFLVAWRRLDQVLAADSGLAWLYGVAYRTIGNQIRSRNRFTELRARILRQPPVRPVSVERSVELGDDVERVLRALSTLSARDQEIIRLAAFEGLTVSEIAQAVGGTTASARSKLYRARKRLRIASQTQDGAT